MNVVNDISFYLLDNDYIRNKDLGGGCYTYYVYVNSSLFIGTNDTNCKKGS